MPSAFGKESIREITEGSAGMSGEEPKNLSVRMSLPPTTTAQEDIVVAGQRHISLLWEIVQGVISITVTASVIYCQIKSIQSETINNAFFFVIATYLQRTNHVRIGGIGKKADEDQPYKGR